MTGPHGSLKANERKGRWFFAVAAVSWCTCAAIQLFLPLPSPTQDYDGLPPLALFRTLLFALCLSVAPAFFLWGVYAFTRCRRATWRWWPILAAALALWVFLLQTVILRMPPTAAEWLFIALELLPLSPLLLATVCWPWLPLLRRSWQTERVRQNAYFLSAASTVLLLPPVLLLCIALHLAHWAPVPLRRALTSGADDVLCPSMEESIERGWPFFKQMSIAALLPDSLWDWAVESAIAGADTENALECMAIHEARERWYRSTTTISQRVAMDRARNPQLRFLALRALHAQDIDRAQITGKAICAEGRTDALGGLAARLMAPIADAEAVRHVYASPLRWEFCLGLTEHPRQPINTPCAALLHSLLRETIRTTNDPAELKAALRCAYVDFIAPPEVWDEVLARSADSDTQIRTRLCEFAHGPAAWVAEKLSAMLMQHAASDPAAGIRALNARLACEQIQCHDSIKNVRDSILRAAADDPAPEVQAELIKGLCPKAYYYFYTTELLALQKSLLLKLARSTAPLVRSTLASCIADPEQFQFMEPLREELFQRLNSAGTKE